MTSPDLAHALWRQILDSCRGVPGDDARLSIFLGQFLAWHLLPITCKEFPESLRAPESGSSVTGQMITEAWQKLARCVEIGDTRFAFAETSEDVHRHLAQRTLSELNDFMGRLILLDEGQRIGLATHVAKDSSNPFLVAQRELPHELADFMVRLVKPGKGESVFCPGPMANTVAVAVMQAGNQPRVVSEQAPVTACI